jgi:hypothetical protein
VSITIERRREELIANMTGLATRVSISTSVWMANLAVLSFTTSDTRESETRGFTWKRVVYLKAGAY